MDNEIIDFEYYFIHRGAKYFHLHYVDEQFLKQNNFASKYFHLHLGRKCFCPKILIDSFDNKQILSSNALITIGDKIISSWKANNVVA